MRYLDYLQTTHWQEIKEKTYTPNSKCHFCHTKEKLNIHHRRYRSGGKSVLFHEQPRHLLVLCQNCHHDWHSIQGKAKLKEKHLLRMKFLLEEGVEVKTAIELCSSHLRANNHLKISGRKEMPEKLKHLRKLYI